MVRLGNDWDDALHGEFDLPYYLNLREFLRTEYGTYTVYPPMHDIFNCLKAAPRSAVKVVILGQDPYHNEGQAHGLCFSVRQGVEIPPSLVNIYKEIRTDLNVDDPGLFRHGDLTAWAQQGVLLLNAVLTVRAHAAFSHCGKGWETFTDAVIGKVNDGGSPSVFLLWGAAARKKAALVTNPIHLVLQAAHPSPLSAYQGFFGCRHFSRANEFLTEHGLPPIDWTIK
jgi:uracil-DNA glycosylase